MNVHAPPSVRAHIHPKLYPCGSIEDGSIDEVAEAEAWLREHGCTHARGPMGPTTWHPYRATVQSDERPAFLGEPTFSPFVWEARGYSICANYASALASNVSQIRSATARSKALQDAGWTLQSLEDRGGFASGLRQLHSIATSAFQDAFSYTALDFPSFEALYTPMQPLIEPNLVLLAVNPSGEAAGFCFAIPDRLNPDSKQFIIKTLAVSHRYRQVGAGSWLTAAAHERAHEMGWTEGGIHALMWTDSHSRRISQHAGAIFRRYALYEKKL